MLRRLHPLVALLFGPFALGCGDDGTGESAAPDEGPSVTITTEPVLLQPGEETWKCQSFANPFHGEHAEVARWESVAEAGTHHVILAFDGVPVANFVDIFNVIQSCRVGQRVKLRILRGETGQESEMEFALGRRPEGQE